MTLRTEIALRRKIEIANNQLITHSRWAKQNKEEFEENTAIVKALKKSIEFYKIELAKEEEKVK